MPGSRAGRLPDRDLEHVLDHTQGLWEDLRDARLFVTGGSGFFGRWMLETFVRANEVFGLRAQVTALSRDPRRFAEDAPHIAGDPSIRLCPGDVKTFERPSGPCTHVLHLATEAGPSL